MTDVPSKVIYEMFAGSFIVDNTIQGLGDEHKIKGLGINMHRKLAGYFGKAPTDITQRSLYAITITFDNIPQTDGIADRRLAFLKEAEKRFKGIGQSIENGKKLIFDEDAPYRSMFEFAYQKKGKETSF